MGSSQLTLFAGDSLASHSVLPGSKEALKMTVTSGQKCSGLLKNSNPLGLLVKTLLVSSEWRSMMCYLTWKVKATPANRLLFQLVPSMPSTDEIESGLLPTPRAIEVIEHPMKQAERLKDRTGTKPNNLQSMACFGMFPTPLASDAMGGIIGKNDTYYTTKTGMPRKVNQNGKDGSVGLARLVKFMPTPTTVRDNDSNHTCAKYYENKKQEDVMSFIVEKMLPTPKASDFKGSPGKEKLIERSCHSRGVPLPEQVMKAGIDMEGFNPSENRLNPEFVQQMMGFPDKWFDEMVDKQITDMEHPTASPVVHKDDLPADTKAKLKALGNAVVPNIPYLIGKEIQRYFQ